MCQTIIITKKTEKRQTKIYIDTIQEFIDYFGFFPQSKAKYGKFHLNRCLCQIDIEKELKEHGIDFITNGFDYEILVPNNIQNENIEMEHDPIESENETLMRKFNLQEILAFTNKHDVQVIRNEDYSYMIFIDKQGGYGNATTPMYALWSGIQQFKKQQLCKTN